MVLRVAFEKEKVFLFSYFPTSYLCEWRVYIRCEEDATVSFYVKAYVSYI